MSFQFPLVSVIVPTYNDEAFISQTLDSILTQTYKNLEVLVVNDGSQDRTAEIIASIAQKDQRVILFQQSNTGVAAARNLAIQNSNGEYIAPIDADDIWYPQKLEKQVQCFLQSEPSVGLVYAWSVYIDEEGLIIGEYNAQDFFSIYNLEGEIYPALVYRNIIGNASVPLIRRTCFERVGGYNYNLKKGDAQGCEDWELCLRIAEYYQLRVVPEFLVGYRQLAGSMSGNYASMAKSYNLVIRDVQQRHPEIPSAIFRWSSSFFYTYLLGKSYGCGDYWGTLGWLYKVLQSDFILFFVRPGLHKAFITCLLKILAKLVFSLIWQSQPSWFHISKRFKHQGMTISDINRQMHKPQCLWKPYDRLLLQRWSRVVRICQSAKVKNFLIIFSLS